MRAMILAAGRGERMRPLTDMLPKPLIPVAGKPLIQWHIEKLAAVGITDIVINHAWLGALIERTLGDGSQFGVHLRYSAESSALETAGGIATALPMLGTEPFLVMNGDIWCDWDPAEALTIHQQLSQKTSTVEQTPEIEQAPLAWLLLVPNPSHHPNGDFGLSSSGLISANEGKTYTFSGIGVYKPALFVNSAPGRAAKLAPLLYGAIAQRAILGKIHHGFWIDVGTPERLSTLECMLSG